MCTKPYFLLFALAHCMLKINAVFCLHQVYQFLFRMLPASI